MIKNKLLWSGISWNPLKGKHSGFYCSKVSAGCDNCYAEKLSISFGGVEYKDGVSENVLDDNALHRPYLSINRVIDVCDMSDLFHETTKKKDIMKIFETMNDVNDREYRILTKRPKAMVDFVNNERQMITSEMLLGFSAENQQTYNERIAHFHDIEDRNFKTWVCVEPVLEKINLQLDKNSDCLSWVVVAGEVGENARGAQLAWFKNIIEQCSENSVPCFVKALGRTLATKMDMNDRRGSDIENYPPVFQKRELPK